MILKIARFEVRPEEREFVEKAMAEFADYVAKELEGSDWATYRERGNPNRYVSIISLVDQKADERHRRAPGTLKFTNALYPRLVAEPQFLDYELVATSEP